MADTTTAVGHAPIPLLANSYDFQKLEAATLHAEGLKKEDNQAVAFGKIASEQALDQDIVKGREEAALPEESVRLDDGTIVGAPEAAVKAEEPAPPAEKPKGGTKGTTGGDVA